MPRGLSERIGKFQVIAMLGEGGMARVMLTVASGPGGFNKLLVIKELREELAHDPEHLTMFMDEARLAARLSHPNVVQTYDVVEGAGRHYIVMQYLEGQPLNRILQRVGRDEISLLAHLRVIRKVLSGLQYAHTLTDFDGTPLNVVHRDVSPANVFVTYDGQVKLVDFGIAKAEGAANITKEGQFKGKISYIAPEQAHAREIDARADVFSVGVMLWEALAQRRINGGNDLETLRRRVHDEDPPIRELAPDAPEALLAICEKAMAHDPADRFASAADMQEAIEAYLDDQPRRIGTKELKSLMGQAFEASRKRIRLRIEEKIAQIVDAGNNSGAVPILDLDASRHSLADPHIASIPPPAPLEGEEPDTLVRAGERTSRGVVSAPRAGGSSRWVLPALGILAAGVAFAAVLVREPPAPQAPSAPAAPTAVSIRIEVEPRDAMVTLDGEALSKNPYRGERAIDDGTHRLVARRGGYVTVQRKIRFDRDQNIAIALAPAKRVQPVAAAPTATASASAKPPAPKKIKLVPYPRGRKPKPAPPKPGPAGLDRDNPY